MTVGYHQDKSATMHPYGHLVILAVVVLDSWVQTIDCFFSLWVCIAPLIIVRTRPQVGGFQITCNSVASRPVSEVCGFFSIQSYLQVQEASKGSDKALPLPWPVTWSQVSHAQLLGFLRWSMTLGESFIASCKLYVFFISYIIYPYKLVGRAYQNLVDIVFELCWFSWCP